AGACAGWFELAQHDDLYPWEPGGLRRVGADGTDGLGYEEVLPYFRRAEDNERGESYYHGVGGPLTVSDGRSMHPLVGACIDAAVDAGSTPTDDHNGPTQEGTSWFQFTQRNGRRCSTAVAYLHPAGACGNVVVLTDALATRVLFEDERAVGVEVLRNNSLEPVRAEREVIVCAGAYHSPHLLLLSGIGPADELQALAIEPRIDLPVGHNLHDHPFAGLVWLTDQESLRRAATRRTSPCSSTRGVDRLPPALPREARSSGECHKVCVRRERMEPHAFNTREDLISASLF
ncbi:MAG TPA: GMC family oxidoreductase N-terminal domain-containing protein, partial [Solirubrobacteraceae bacterium]|nr:GMC family oxidoreductase N-terminal domain-containing protein [Solirubrobacteraceae bacterium]